MATIKPKEIIVRCLLILAGLIISVLILEGIIKVFQLECPAQELIYKDTIVINKPNSEFINKKENVNLVKFNNFGFHDKNINIKDESYRILFLGDSILERRQVPIEHLFTSLLEEKLKMKKQPVDVVNAGV